MREKEERKEKKKTRDRKERRRGQQTRYMTETGTECERIDRKADKLHMVGDESRKTCKLMRKAY